MKNQIRQAIANVALEGLQPSDYAIELLRDVVYGHKSMDDAIAELRQHYRKKL